jgi:hypothetical protein
MTGGGMAVRCGTLGLVLAGAVLAGCGSSSSSVNTVSSTGTTSSKSIPASGAATHQATTSTSTAAPAHATGSACQLLTMQMAATVVTAPVVKQDLPTRCDYRSTDAAEEVIFGSEGAPARLFPIEVANGKKCAADPSSCGLASVSIKYPVSGLGETSISGCSLGENANSSEDVVSWVKGGKVFSVLNGGRVCTEQHQQAVIALAKKLAAEVG